MKKASVFLIALVLIVASVPLFAQGKWTNWGEGILYPYYQVGSATASNGWGPNWDNIAGADQEWTFGYDGNNYGFAATFEFGSDQFASGTSATNTNITWWQAYYKLFDMVKLTFGKPNIRDYRLSSKIEGLGYNALFNWGDNNGMAIQLMPMAGLSLGVALYVPVVNAATNTAALDYATSIGAGASYAIPDLATIAVDWKNTTAAKNFSVGVNVTAVKDIGLVLAYQADYTNAQLVNSAFLSASAAFAPIAVAVDAAVKMGAATYYAAEIDVQYAMGMWVLGVTGGYDNGEKAGAASPILNGTGTGVPAAGVAVYPYLKANFDNGSNVKIGFIYAGGVGTTGATIAFPVLYTVAF